MTRASVNDELPTLYAEASLRNIQDDEWLVFADALEEAGRPSLARRIAHLVYGYRRYKRAQLSRRLTWEALERERERLWRLYVPTHNQLVREFYREEEHRDALRRELYREQKHREASSPGRRGS